MVLCRAAPPQPLHAVFAAAHGPLPVAVDIGTMSDLKQPPWPRVIYRTTLTVGLAVSPAAALPAAPCPSDDGVVWLLCASERADQYRHERHPEVKVSGGSTATGQAPVATITVGAFGAFGERVRALKSWEGSRRSARPGPPAIGALPALADPLGGAAAVCEDVADPADHRNRDEHDEHRLHDDPEDLL